MVVHCRYSGGEPADAEVLVYSPAAPDRVYQRLRTDVRGLASFVPDTDGLWLLVADDGVGHRTHLEISVNEEGVAIGTSGASTPSLRDLAVFGLLGLALLAWWKLRRRTETG